MTAEAQTTPPSPAQPETPARQRGGQPGNANAFKHGFYARKVPGLKDAALEALETGFPGMEEEIFVLRIYIRRLLEYAAFVDRYDDDVQLIRTLCLAFTTLARLTREHRAFTAEPIDTLAALRKARSSVAETRPPDWAYEEFFTPYYKSEGDKDEEFNSLEELDAQIKKHHEPMPPDLFDSPASASTSSGSPSPQAHAPLSPAYATASPTLPEHPASPTPPANHPPACPDVPAFSIPENVPGTPGASSCPGGKNPPPISTDSPGLIETPRGIRLKDPFAPLINPLIADSPELIEREIRSNLDSFLKDPPLHRRRSHPPEPWTFDRKNLF